MIIKARFANRHHPRVIQLGQQPVQGRRFARLEIQRVNTHRAVHVVITLGQSLYGTGIVGTDTDAQKMPDTSATRGFKGSVQRAIVLGEVKAVEVTMRIYKHG
ncbi:hypothetical protein PSCICO_33290 [Pseudomonas cichorii]|nr:hypothetical protein PSCICO_33290 [Pseudomonas cichorii]